jgi:hypothetical protein
MKRKCLILLAVLAMVLVWAFSVQAYTISDPSNDSIGYPTYESYGIDVYNFTPGIESGSIIVDLFTNFPQAGKTVNSGSWSWATLPADLFITETYHGQEYQWAVPLVTHDGFTAGTMYAVGTSLVSDDFDPSGGTGYIYNHNVPVQIATSGNNYGWTSLGSGSASWSTLAGLPDYMVRLNLGIWEDDPNGIFVFTWGTATCANDVITGRVPAVPIPPTVFLLGSGLLGLGILGRRRKQKA